MKATDTNLVAEKAAVENEIAQTAADHQERMAALRAKKAEIDDAVLVQTRESAIAAKGAHGKRQIELIHAMCGDEEIRLAAIERLEGHLRAAVAAIPAERELEARQLSRVHRPGVAADLRHNSLDTRPLPLMARRAKLENIVGRFDNGFIRFSETFPDAERLLAECEKHGLEGIAKRKDAPYRSGKCDWVKVKTKVWREANKSRGELFNPRKPSP